MKKYIFSASLAVLLGLCIGIGIKYWKANPVGTTTARQLLSLVGCIPPQLLEAQKAVASSLEKGDLKSASSWIDNRISDTANIEIELQRAINTFNYLKESRLWMGKGVFRIRGNRFSCLDIILTETGYPFPVENQKKYRISIPLQGGLGFTWVYDPNQGKGKKAWRIGSTSEHKI